MRTLEELKLRLIWDTERYNNPAVVIGSLVRPLRRIKDVIEIEENYEVEVPAIVYKGSEVALLKLGKEETRLSYYDYKLPKELIKKIDSLELEDYQKEALYFLLRRKKVLLALPTGTGKTRIVLEALKLLDSRALVIVPQKSLISNWEKEIEKWKANKDNIELINIHKLVRDEERLKEILSKDYQVIIVDEAHEILKKGSGKKKALSVLRELVKKINYKHLWLLTATPIVNSLFDDGLNYLSIFNVRFYTQLRERKEDKEIREWVLQRVLKWFIFHRFVEKDVDVEREFIRIKIDDERAIRLFTVFVNYLRELAYRRYKGDLTEFEFKQKAFKLINKYLSTAYLLWNGFQRNGKESNFNLDHPKVKKLKEILENHNEKVIIFFYHKNGIKLAKILAEQLNRPFFEISGDTSKNARRIISEFKRTNNGILAISIKAGGLGLDFPEVNTAIFYEYWWTFTSIHQAENRIIRKFSDQKKKKIYYLISYIEELGSLAKYSTIDIWMFHKIKEKKESLELLLRGEKDNREDFFKGLIDEVRKNRK